MPGILGMRRFHGQSADSAILRKMALALAHHGPDGAGSPVRREVGLGHRQLSSIDLRQAQQPVSSPHDRSNVPYNSEMPDYQQPGAQTHHPYMMARDSEVLPATHATQRPASVKRLVGQSAPTTFYRNTAELWLYRDRLGVLSLYHYWNDRVFLLASKIDAIFSGTGTAGDIDVRNFSDSLAKPSNPATWTYLDEVHRKMPFAFLRIHLDGSVTQSLTMVGRPKVALKVSLSASFCTCSRNLVRDGLIYRSALVWELFDHSGRRDDASCIRTLQAMEVWNAMCRRTIAGQSSAGTSHHAFLLSRFIS